MTTKKPIVLTNGEREELQSGDSVAASDIGFVNTGTNLAGTTAQTALNELDLNTIVFSVALG
jgi:hypothetical protein